MKIIVLDGFAANPGDLSWEGIKALGECVIYDRTAPEEVLERAAGAEVLLTNKVIINAEHMAALPELKYIGVLATGYNVVDTVAAKERGIVVTNIPSYSTASVAQMVFAHILNISQQVQHHSEEVHKGRWTNSKDFCFWDTPLIELRDKKIGLVGLGNTGYTTARVAIGFGMQVYALTSKSHFQLPPEIKKMDLDQLFSECDIISLHCPLTPETHEMVNARRLAMMKPTAILINTGRGPLINEQDLADALNSGKIFAAGVDVLSTEPPHADNPLLTAKNCYITPHIAWATLEARERLMNIAISNLQAYIAGTPENVVKEVRIKNCFSIQSDIKTKSWLRNNITIAQPTLNSQLSTLNLIRVSSLVHLFFRYLMTVDTTPSIEYISYHKRDKYRNISHRL